MAEEAGDDQQAAKQITFNVKSSSDSKYVITVPEDISVLDLKQKLSTSEYADVPPERQRLIYSGRVLKDTDELSVYKIKDGNTVHLVKGAASNQRQAPASQSGASSVPPGAGNPASNVPSNFQTGTGTDPLAGLTGARYAGFAQLPGADQFGPDGGMGPPQGPEEMLRMLDNPMFQSQMNEAMNNPHVIQMMQNSPAVRSNPWLRQMLENPEVRRMMMDPNVIRQSMQMSRMMGGAGGVGGAGGNAMPAPGVTDTTPQGTGAATGGSGSATPGQTDATGATNTSQTPQNPFGGMFGAPGMGAAGGQGNPFAALFGGAGGGGMGALANPPAGTNPSQNAETRSTDGQPPNQNQQPNPANPLANLFGGMGGQPGQTGQQGQQTNPMGNMMQQMMQNPQMMQMAMQMMGMGGGDAGQQGGAPAGSDAAGGQQGQGQPANPFASLFGPGGMGGGGLGALGGMGMGSQPAAPPDTRPPEEQYAEQLRQLNDMGFYEFDRNVRALRMAGGNVQGAVEVLLGGS